MKNQIMKGGEQFMSKKAMIYCRVASVDQISSTSLETQRLECMKFARRNGYEVIGVVQEQGSGLRTSNQLQKILDGIKIGEINTLIASRIDRLGRNLLIIKKTIDEVEMNKGEVRFSNEPNSPEEAKLFRGIALGAFDYYSQQISLAVKRGLAARKKRLAAAQSK